MTVTINDIGDFNLRRGDTLVLNLTNLGDVSARTNLYFTIKDETEDADTASIVQIDENTGLLYIMGAAASVAANGSITVTNAALGNMTVRLEAVETAKITACNVFFWDLQMLTATDVETLKSGRVRPIGDITRAVT